MGRQVAPRLHVGIAVLFLVAVSVFLGPRIYADRTILVGDGTYYVDPSFRAAVPVDAYVTRPRNFLSHVDNALNGYPRMHFVQTSLSSGEIPWWNPYLGLGIPGAGTASATFEPIELVLGRLVSVPMLSNLKAVAGLVVGAYGMFLLLLALGATRTAAVLAGVAFAFSGWSVAWLGRTNMLAEMWMPWLFWAAERVLGGGPLRFVAAAALFTGCASLSSHPQTAVHILSALALYVALRAFRREAPRAVLGLRAAWLAGAVVVGLGIALVQLVPSADVIAHAEVPPRGRSLAGGAAGALGVVGAALAGDWTIIRRDLPTAVMTVAPLFFGSAATGTYWWRGLNMMEIMAYTGLLPLAFAGYAAWRRRDVRGVGVWLALTAVAFGAMYALPLFNAVNYLPVIGLANNGRLRLVFRFALVVAAALGFDRLVADLDARRPGWARLTALYVAVVVGLPAGVYAGLHAWATVRVPPLSTMLAREAGVAVVLVALVALVTLRARGRLGRTPFRALVVVLAFADPLWHLGDFNPPIPTAHVFPETPLVRFLREDRSLYRVSSGTHARVLTSDSKLPYRLYDTDLFDVLNVARYARLQRTVNGATTNPFNTLRAFAFHDDPARHRGLMSLMNVKYLLLPGTDLLREDPLRGVVGFRLVYDREVKVYENLAVMPRAFLVDRAVHVSADEALVAITRPDFDPRTAPVLLEDPAAPALPAPGAGVPGTAEVTALSANRVVVRTSAARPGYLLLAETNYPGWRAAVDGAPTTVYQANYLFRAVLVPAGAHEVTFSFAPTAYRVALAGSLGCLAAVAGVFVGDAIRRVRGVQA